MHQSVNTLFNYLMISIGAFVLAIGIAARKKWITSREVSFVAPVLVIMAALTVGNFLYKVSPHTTSGIGMAALTDTMFTLAIAMALMTIWKRTKKDEEEEKTGPKPKLKTSAAGPVVSASELRKRKKKRA